MHYLEKYRTLQQIAAQGLIAVVRGRTMEEGIRTAEACIAGGVRIIELAFTTPQATRAIETLTKKYAQIDDVVIGAGTVLEPTSARLAILSGAKFIVSPTFDEEVVRLCNLYRVACCPGVMTPDGVTKALSAGADIIKMFPGDLLGPRAIKDIHGPLPQAPLMPSGGVSLENIAAWLQAGCIAVSAGSSLTAPAKHSDFQGVERMAQKFTAAVKEALGQVPAEPVLTPVA
ncbi:bifunctional 2-keto-4-hydroxyglutarate aldolase/2-keto-3-deoxy-6-phosphogluconate aldolase [Mitsuokella sp. WILCCON 0060]|uniref:bifunctional 2-keto-4-hydroxyglutarate aldolase/2-keto-3-deoxy-6-phosphogluconate aldolase n=1 Tax=unclassified Mitsuokella TaxID=2637239 RepID=UPI003F122216